MKDVLLSTTYFGPVQWYQKLYRAEHVLIEQWEHFEKQSYRNRCLIATTQGIQALTVPVERGNAQSSKLNAQSSMLKAQSSKLKAQTIKDIRISDHGNWRHLHWNALQSAYGESPFFDYYQDDIRPFFEERWTYLIEFNEAIRAKMCELLDIQPRVSYTQSWRGECGGRSEITSSAEYAGDTLPADYSPSSLHTPPSSKSFHDFRSSIHPKHPGADEAFEPRPYYQVYRQKHGFLPNLSILDLLFNMGPEAIFYL